MALSDNSDFSPSWISHGKEGMLETEARDVCALLKSLVDDFMRSLGPDDEVGISVASFGTARTISIASVRSVGRNMLIFSGFENGLPVQLVQHVSQLSLILQAIPKADRERPARRIIGFYSE